MEDQAGFLTSRELADLAGVRESVVLWWQSSGEGPAHEIVYGRTIYRATAIDEWLRHESPSRAVARFSSSINSSTSLAASRVFADAPAAA